MTRCSWRPSARCWGRGRGGGVLGDKYLFLFRPKNRSGTVRDYTGFLRQEESELGKGRRISDSQKTENYGNEGVVALFRKTVN